MRNSAIFLELVQSQASGNVLETVYPRKSGLSRPPGAKRQRLDETSEIPQHQRRGLRSPEPHRPAEPRTASRRRAIERASENEEGTTKRRRRGEGQGARGQRKRKLFSGGGRKVRARRPGPGDSPGLAPRCAPATFPPPGRLEMVLRP